MYPQAIEEFTRGAQLAGDKDLIEVASAYQQGFRISGWKGALEKAITVRKAHRQNGHVESAYFIAEDYAELGDKDRAFEWLSLAYQEHDVNLLSLKTDFLFDSLHSDPRFSELARKIGLP